MSHLDQFRSHTVLWWNVMFLARPAASWWDHLSPEWARHVVAFGYAPGGGQWVVVDPANRRTMMSVLPDGPIFDAWLDPYLNAGARVVRIEAQDGPVYGNRLGNWCTQTIARLVGSRRGAWRPKALHDDLLSMGATPVFQETPDVVQGRSA